MKTVAVTTSADRAAAAAMPFTFLSLQPLALPCISIEVADDQTLDEARAASREADLVVISSRRTMHILWPDGQLPDAGFAVVGAATARAVMERHGRVVMTGAGGSSQLVDRLAYQVAGKHVVWPHARGADPAPLETIERRAGRFTAPVVYSSVPVAPPLDPVEVVTFASPSAVAGWLLSRSLSDRTIAVIGETTRRAVDNAGSPVTIVAPNPTFQSLAQAVAEHLGVEA